MEAKAGEWYQIGVCPECGKKLKATNDIIVPHRYICRDCYWNVDRYRRAVDQESSLSYDRDYIHYEHERLKTAKQAYSV